MTILESDIKLLKSAVMGDTADGGGAMTGTVIQDGASNNIFPDTSEIDRALGRVSMRKAFAAVQTDNTDMLLGAHAMLTDAPDDPLVNCLLMEATGWNDTRSQAQAKIEQYLVKGPRRYCRLFENHFAGSLQIRLYVAGVSSDDFPAANDTIVLRNPINSNEQYVRVRKTALSTATYSINENGSVVPVQASVMVCDLSSELLYDFPGAPMARILNNETATYASVYQTTPAVGAKFYGIKTLGEAASVGDRSVMVDDGVFSPLVPSATTPAALTDQMAYTTRGTLARTAQSAVSIYFTMQTAGTTNYLPTAVVPGTFAVPSASPAISDDGTGNLVAGGNSVGTIDYRAGSFVMTAATYNGASYVADYTPATNTAGAIYSTELLVTPVNQSIVYTQVFEPIPSPGTFKLSYMAQGRWYDIADRGDGRLVGSDSSYGSGTISYASGSASFTLGALPDTGSVLVASWAGASAAVAPAAGTLPSKWYTMLDLGFASFGSAATLTWTGRDNATPRTATISTTGVFSSSFATGSLINGKLRFEPQSFVSGSVSVNLTSAAAGLTDMAPSGSNQWTAPGGSIHKGSFRAVLTLGTYPSDVIPFQSAHAVFDRGDGVLYARLTQLAIGSATPSSAVDVAVGVVNYATGVVALASSVQAQCTIGTEVTSPASGGFASFSYQKYELANRTINTGTLSNLQYTSGATTTSTVIITPTDWQLDVPVRTAGMSMINNDMLFCNSFALTNQGVSASARNAYWMVVKNGVLKVPNQGTPAVWANAVSVPGATVSPTGIISIPHSTIEAWGAESSANSTSNYWRVNGTNSVYWANVALNSGPALSSKGVFRTATSPLQPGIFQLLKGSLVANGDNSGNLSGGTAPRLSGTIDYDRGVVRWTSTVGGGGASADNPSLLDPSALRYNAVFLEFVPLNANLLGLETARLPSDGRVPIYRSGGICVVHNTQDFTLPNPLTKNNAYSVGRNRLASVKMVDAAGTLVPSTLYTADLDAGTVTIPTASVITAYAQPFTVKHRIEDVVLCSKADISGALTFTRALTHAFPADTSYVSSALLSGDLQARATNSFEQTTWTGVWSDTRTGSAPTGNYNEVLNPIVMNNKGAITERWALVFTNTTTFNIIGETSGVIGTGTIGATCAPLNPATSAPYFSIPAAGWGSGWATGNVYRFNTSACGVPLWMVRTVLQGPATLQDDKFSIAFRGDVDRA